MARPIVIEFAANVRDFLRGSKDVERATGDIADELKDAGRDAERFEREFRDSMRDAEKAADRSARKMGDDFGRVKGDLGEVGKEGSQEFRQNLAEGLSSGNMEDIVQDTLGGVVSGLSGPIGYAAAALAGLGAIAFNQLRERAEEINEFASTIADNIAGQLDWLNARLNEVTEVEALKANVETVNEQFYDMRGDIEKLGIGYEEFVAIVASGNSNEFADLITLLETERDLTGTITDGRGNTVRVHREEQDIARDLLGYVTKEREEVDKVYGKRDAMNEALAISLSNAQGLAAAWQETANYAQRTLDSVKNIPTDVRTRLEVYATGSGAAYINPHSGNYSPGHVAIVNDLQNRARNGTR